MEIAPRICFDQLDWTEMSRFEILTARSEQIQDGHVVSRFRYLAVKEEKKSAGLVFEDMDNYRFRGNWGFLDDYQIRFMRRLKTFRVDLDWDRFVRGWPTIGRQDNRTISY